MEEPNTAVNTLEDIKQMMERSSRFISLSGLSGIAAGACALAGAWFAHMELNSSIAEIKYEGLRSIPNTVNGRVEGISLPNLMHENLFIIAVCTFLSAFSFSFIFTYLRSKQTGTPIWGNTARRLLINVAVPMIAGGFFLLKLLQSGAYTFIAPACLLFYGLALVNASKYTLGEIKYLGYTIILLGLVNLWIENEGLLFWSIGFGVFHIIYGTVMWWRYERNTPISK